MQNPQDVHTAMTFRFLDLPFEVRNAIYNVILCSPPPRKLRRMDQGDLLPLPRGLNYIIHPQETQILHLNRQIHAEARDVMLRGNQLIRIRVRGMGRAFENLMIESQIPVVRTSALSSSTSKDFVLTHSIQSKGVVSQTPPQAAPPPWTDLVILRRDLDAFCAMFAFRGFLAFTDFGTQVEHGLEVHDPFDDTLSPGFMSEKNQERLLGPYREHMRGISRFDVRGRVSAEVARSVEDAVRQVPIPEPDEVIKELRRKKDLGNGYFRQMDFLRAAEAYSEGINKVMHLRNSPAWAKVKAEGGDDFLRALAETFYQVCLNATQNILTAVRDDAPTDEDYHDGWPDHWAQMRAARAEAHTSAAMEAAARLETDWRPTLAQMAKASYRMATVQRARGCMERAKTYIDAARQQAPGDPLIRREAEEIDGLVRSQAGLGRLLV